MPPVISTNQYPDIIDHLIALSLEAGNEIMAIYETDFIAGEKSDGSSITQADKAAEKIILASLRKAYPNIPILAEEEASEGNIPDLGETFFLVDPLDGTKEFVNRTGEFTVNIALIDKEKPILGIVFAPALKKLWGGQKNEGAFILDVSEVPFQLLNHRQPIKARQCPDRERIAVASRSHRSEDTELLLKKLGAEKFEPAGSSLKFCLLAEGKADLYPRLGRTMEWDTAAGQAVLEAAGGQVNVFLDGTEQHSLTYGKSQRGFDNPHFIAWGAKN